MSFPKAVKIVEVGPRDGLQNISARLDIETRVILINKLTDADVTYVEAGSFVNPDWVPQMADSDRVFAGIKRVEGVTYAGLTPNLKGFERAMAAGANEVAIFAAASETFSQKNINCSISESLKRFEPVMEAAVREDVPVRAYISCVLGCPYEGEVEVGKVSEVSRELIDMGCYEVSLGDTIGVGTPVKARQMVEAAAGHVAMDKLAVHFHDTYGMALANIFAALELGISTVDSAVAGLGGCPYAKGASGNVSTEDVIYMLNGMEIETGVNIKKLIEAGKYIIEKIGQTTGSKVALTNLGGEVSNNS